MAGSILKKLGKAVNPLKVIKAVLPAIGTALSTGGKIAEMAVEFVGKEILGISKPTVTDIVEHLRNAAPEELSAIREKDMQFQLECLQLGVNLFELQVKDMESAREMYLQRNEQTDKLSNQIMIFSLPIIIILIVVTGVMYYLGVDQPVVYTLAGGALTHFYNERQSVVNFYLGSSLGSKLKSKMMQEIE